MKNQSKKTLYVTLVALGTAAMAGFAFFKRKKREEVFKEAELKAMEELDDLLADIDKNAEELDDLVADIDKNVENLNNDLVTDKDNACTYESCEFSPEKDIEVEIIMEEAANEEEAQEVSEEPKREEYKEEYLEKSDN